MSFLDLDHNVDIERILEVNKIDKKIQKERIILKKVLGQTIQDEED